MGNITLRINQGQSFSYGRPAGGVDFLGESEIALVSTGYKAQKQHLLLSLPLTAYEAHILGRYANFLLHLPQSANLSLLTGLHIAGDKIIVFLGHIFGLEQRHLLRFVNHHGDSDYGKNIKEGLVTGLAPGHTTIIAKGHAAQLSAALRAKCKMHNYLLLMPAHL